MTIHFQIEYITRWGENLFLCLNMADGTQQCLDMSNNGQGTWFTDCEIDDDELTAGDITYCYMVQTDGAITRREEGSLHSIPYTRAKRLVLSDRWKDYGGKSIEQRTVALPYVHHNNRPRWKGAGTAIPVFSLRSERDYGIGQFTDLKLLVDWAAATGQSIIQTLPVNDTTMTGTWRDSYPYSANSSFALNPVYIDLELIGTITDKKFLRKAQKERRELNALPAIDYERVFRLKSDYLDRLYAARAVSSRSSSVPTAAGLNRTPFTAICATSTARPISESGKNRNTPLPFWTDTAHPAMNVTARYASITSYSSIWTSS